MGDTISVRLGKGLEKELALVEKRWHIDRSEIIRRFLDKSIKDWKIEDALQRLAAHKITIGKAAEDADISLWDMLDLVKERKIDWIGLTPERLEKDFEIAMQISKKIK